MQLDSTELFTLDCNLNELTSLDTSASLENLTLVDCGNNNIASLDFRSNINLHQIDCDWNQLTSLLVDGVVTWLQVINCQRNSLTSLNVSDNINLTSINMSYNDIAAIDVTNNTKLSNFYCSNNDLTELNLTKNTDLTHLDAPYNNLMTVDARNGNNTKMSSASKFRLSNNPNLQCVYVDDITYSTATWTQVDASGTFVINESACQALSINSYEVSNINLFPNPVKNRLELSTSEPLKKVDVYNTLGKKVKTSTSTKINLSNLKSGIYILIIDLKNGDRITKKIVKEI